MLASVARYGGRRIVRLHFLGFVFCAFAIASCGGKPVTRGDVADRQAALDVAECVKGYSGGSSNAANWTLCVDAVSELQRRDPIKVRGWVNKQQGRQIFP